ncbi:MAG: hypothetical protein JST85_17125 [Acidobacteria bacterium]|nr:hypothetical protein [Acidobacteriota bacterium]
MLIAQVFYRSHILGDVTAGIQNSSGTSLTQRLLELAAIHAYGADLITSR